MRFDGIYMNEKIVYGGIATLLIILSSGITYYVQDSGTKTSCLKGWEYVNEGSYEGYYRCLTATSVRYEMCFEVYNSSNTVNYWCKKGVLVKTEEKKIVNSNKVICDSSICWSLNNS